MKQLNLSFIALLIFATHTVFAGELYIAKGMSSMATPLGDQSQVQRQVMSAAIETAKSKVPSEEFQQHSEWVTFFFYAGSRIYGVAHASFKNKNEQAPWFVNTSGVYSQVYKYPDQDAQIITALEHSKENAQTSRRSHQSSRR